MNKFLNNAQETQSHDTLKKNKTLVSSFQVGEKMSPQTFLPLLNQWFQENCKIQKNILENQNIFSQIHLIIAEQNRMIHQLQLQIAQQNEKKDSELNNCKKKLQQTKEYVTTLMNKHNQTVNELNQQISDLKNNPNPHVQNENQVTYHNKKPSTFSSTNSSSSSSSSSSINKNKILLSKQNTMPILSSTRSSNIPNFYAKKHKSIDIDFNQSQSQSKSIFVHDIDNLGHSHPPITCNSQIKILQPRISKSSGRRNSEGARNLHFYNNGNVGMTSLKLRKTQSENIQRNFSHNSKNVDEQKEKETAIATAIAIQTNTYINNDNDFKKKNNRNRYSTPIRKNKLLSPNDHAYLKIINKKIQGSREDNTQIKNINYHKNSTVYDENENNDDDSESDLNHDNDNIENELDKIQEELVEMMSENSDVSY